MLTTCPRCNSQAVETLKTHSYCCECNWSPVHEETKDVNTQINLLRSKVKSPFIELLRELDDAEFMALAATRCRAFYRKGMDHHRAR